MRRREFYTLDGIRGIAAVVVVAWHVGPRLGVSLGSAYLAVDLFFMLSGFVVAHAYEEKLRNGWRFGGFMEVRLVRLWPMYLLASTAGLLVRLLDGDRWADVAGTFLAAAIMLPRLNGPSGVAYPLDDPAWSLACELVANVVYAAGAWRLRTANLTAVAAGFLVALAFVAHNQAPLNVALNLGALAAHLPIGLLRVGYGFTAGVVLYRLWRDGWLPVVTVPPWLVMAGAAATLLAFPMAAPHSLTYALLVLIIGFPAVITAGVSVEPSLARRRLTSALARISYPLYLTHFVLIEAATVVARVISANQDAAVVLAGISSLFVAAWVDRQYDLPARRWLARKLALRSGAFPGAPPPS